MLNRTTISSGMSQPLARSVSRAARVAPPSGQAKIPRGLPRLLGAVGDQPGNERDLCPVRLALQPKRKWYVLRHEYMCLHPRFSGIGGHRASGISRRRDHHFTDPQLFST